MMSGDDDHGDNAVMRIKITITAVEDEDVDA